jgi:DNA-binding Lrp family transcriptional regulator
MKGVTNVEKILEILKEDSRISTEDIATMLGQSEEEVKAAIKNLEEKNVIVKYTTLINEANLDSTKVKAFIEARVCPEREMGFDKIAERIYNFPQVSSLYLISGGFDFLIVVEGNSLQDVAMFVSERLSTLEYINSISTHFLLKKYKENGTILAGEKKVDDRILITP